MKKMRDRHKRQFQRRTPPGAAPGTLVIDPAAPQPVVRVLAYGVDVCQEGKLEGKKDLDRLPQIVKEHAVTWVDVEGLGDVETLRTLGKIFGLHELALEDVLNSHQRAKVEQYPNHLFIVARILETVEKLETDQLALFLGQNYVLTFQHRRGDSFDPLRARIRHGGGIIRHSGPDYLAYALLDNVVDFYFPILESLGERIENLEETILQNGGRHLVAHIHNVKADLLLLRRTIWPLRDALHALVRDPNPFIKDETRIYLRDCSDHTFQIIDLLETYRELTSDLLELYHSSLANRMNEIMQVLTVIATIFIPLTFIVGVYGMNFDPATSPWNMPELEWYYGYPAVWIVMLLVAGGMLYFFRRRKWLPFGRDKKNHEPENR